MSEDDPVSITEFLLARITEDEGTARAAIDPDRPGVDWQWEAPDPASGPDAPRWLRTTEEFPTTSGVGPLPAFPLGFEVRVEPSPGMAHIARHDPARVLAECEAKRRIVELHQSWPVLVESPPTIEDAGDLTSVTLRMSQTMAWLTEQEYRSKFGSEPPAAPMLRALAAVYADHPDYDETWTT